MADLQSNIVLLKAPKPPIKVILPIDQREACNFQSRHGYNVAGVVEHIGVAPTFDGLVSYLASCNDREVSATFVIGGDYVGQWALLVGSGPVMKFPSGKLPLDMEGLQTAANHAGIVTEPNNNPHPEWGNPNWWTLGKEHVGYPGQVWTETMIQNDLDCNLYIRAMLGSAFTYVLAHADFDPINRAHCPGPTFPWARIYGRAVYQSSEVIQAMASIPLDQLQALPIGNWDAYNNLLKEY